MAVSLLPVLVTVRDADFCPGEKRMLTGTTDKDCPLAAVPAKTRSPTVATNALTAATSWHELRTFMETPNANAANS
jgi:hypothetical protein